MGLEVDDVIAHAVYDPVARRARYLASRKLKGRQPSTTATPPPKAGQGSRIVDSAVPGSNRHVSAQAWETAQQQAESNARQVAAIKGRLNDLKAHLQELLAKKKAEATSSSSSKSSTSTTKDSKSSNQPKTAKQKAAAKEALKKAQKERAKQQKSTPDKQEGGTSLTLDEQITHTRAVITDVETKLRAALDGARTQTASNGR